MSKASVADDAEFSRELSSEGSQPHIVARLVERAETSEVHLAQAQQELKALKQVATARAAAEGAGTSAAMSAAQVSGVTASSSFNGCTWYMGIQHGVLMHTCYLQIDAVMVCHQLCNLSECNTQIINIVREYVSANTQTARQTCLHVQNIASIMFIRVKTHTD